MRSVPVQSVQLLLLRRFPPPNPSRGNLFCAGALVILFPRRFSQRRPPTSSDSYRKFVPIRLSRPSLPQHSFRPTGSPAEADMEMVQATVLTSFGLVLLLFHLPLAGQNRQCIFYNGAPEAESALADPSRVIWDPVNLPSTTPVYERPAIASRTSRARFWMPRGLNYKARVPSSAGRWNDPRANIKSICHNPDVCIGCTN